MLWQQEGVENVDRAITAVRGQAEATVSTLKECKAHRGSGWSLADGTAIEVVPHFSELATPVNRPIQL